MTRLTALKTIPNDRATSIRLLKSIQLAELQTALVKLGYPAGKIDGRYGHNTRNAWAEFMDDADLENEAETIDGNAVNQLQEALNKAEPDQVHHFTTKNETIETIKSECLRQGIGLKTQMAYVLATADHETNHTFKPVTEAYWLDDPDSYLKKHHADYYPYYGRGFVQLTWDYNYEKYGKLLGKDLLKHPKLALEPEIALFVLVHGFKTGAFTGRKISDYINAHETNFIRARYCINGKDKAEEIAGLAKKHLDKM